MAAAFCARPGSGWFPPAAGAPGSTAWPGEALPLREVCWELNEDSSQRGRGILRDTKFSAKRKRSTQARMAIIRV